MLYNMLSYATIDAKLTLFKEYLVLHQARATRSVPERAASQGKKQTNNKDSQPTHNRVCKEHNSEQEQRQDAVHMKEPHLSRTKSCSRVPGSIELPMVIAPSRMLVL